MSNALRVACASILLAGGLSLAADAKDSSRSQARASRHNSGLVSIVTDSVDSQSMRYAADLAEIFSATLVSAISRMKRCVRSAKASLSARQLSSSTPTA